LFGEEIRVIPCGTDSPWMPRATVTEQIFRRNGIGELLVRSIGQGDIPVIAGVLFIFSVLVIGFNLLADVLYGILDPRVRYA
jgi:peptide/nickel transport system permease protein